MAGEPVKVKGIIELQKALRKIEKDLPKELAAGLAEAAEIVGAHARTKVPVRTGAARDSIKARKQQRSASLATGGSRAPYYPWLDFGGRVGRNKTSMREFVKGGRYIFPALAEKDAQVKEKVDEVLARLAKKAGFDTTGDGAK